MLVIKNTHLQFKRQEYHVCCVKEMLSIPKAENQLHLFTFEIFVLPIKATVNFLRALCSSLSNFCVHITNKRSGFDFVCLFCSDWTPARRHAITPSKKTFGNHQIHGCVLETKRTIGKFELAICIFHYFYYFYFLNNL